MSLTIFGAFSGLLLLAISALCGFLQFRNREDEVAERRWRVVHVGGTAGAVQLLVLTLLVDPLRAGAMAVAILVGVNVATWMFFVGRCLRGG